jgi:hypothetical protein
VSEGENVLGLGPARVSRTVDPHDVRQLKWVELLLHGDAATHALLGVEHDLVPQDLARQRHHVVCVGPGDHDSAGFYKLFGWNQTLG